METVVICKILFQQIDIKAIDSCNSGTTGEFTLSDPTSSYISQYHNPCAYDPINTRIGSYA